MTKFKSQTIWTVVLSFFIPIGFGHALLCIGVLELLGFTVGFRIGTEKLSFSLSADYEKSLGVVALFSLVGHFLLLLPLALKNYYLLFWSRIAGLLFLWIGFLYLIHNFSDNAGSQLGFFAGIPFLIVSILLAYRTLKQYDVVRSEVKV
jgi:hypothetical protein